MMDPNYLCKEILSIFHHKNVSATTLTQPLSERFPPGATPQYVLAKQATLRKLVDGRNLVKHIARFSFDHCNFVKDEERQRLLHSQLNPHGALTQPPRSPAKDVGLSAAVASLTLDLASLSVSLPELALIQGRLTFYGLQYNLTQLLSANTELTDSVVHEVHTTSTYNSTNNVFQALLGFSSQAAPPRLRVVLTPSTGRAAVDPDWGTDLAAPTTEAQPPMSYLQVHSKDALYPPEQGVDTLHIVVVAPGEAEEYIQNYCPRGYVIAVLPSQEDDTSVGCVRFWCSVIARLLKAQWAFFLDDNLAVHEQVRASNAPSNPKHVPNGPKKYALQLMTGVKLLEDVVATLRSANAAKVGLLSLRRAGSLTGNGQAVCVSVCTGVVCVHIEALFAKSLYFRKEMHVYETLYLAQLCLAHKLAALQINYVEYQCVRSQLHSYTAASSVCAPGMCEDNLSQGGFGGDTMCDGEESENECEEKEPAVSERESDAVQALLVDEM